ncbi:hypothetical protein GGD65_006288 [Bradyrhizobium sp. CIR18]|nr:hypothetical protein [Bradyrhizobium sp. CIR18]
MQKATGVAYRFLWTEVKAEKRHIGHEKACDLGRATASR